MPVVIKRTTLRERPLGRGVVLIETKDNQFLEEETKHLREENRILRNQNKDYSLLKKAFGKGLIETWLRQAKEVQQIKKERSRTHGWKR